MNKSKIRRLRRGQLIQAKVVEVLQAQKMILSIDGDLITVTNMTTQNLKSGEGLTLCVTKTQPLEFQRVNEPSNSKRLNYIIEALAILSFLG